MTTSQLLPSNATQLEIDISAAADFLSVTEGALPSVRDAKYQNIPNDVVPWLVYEYGLGELLPYLPDPRTALAEGVVWQRIRGTPQAIKTALTWINFTAILEESEAGTIRWAQFQLGLDQAPASLEFIGNVIGISRLSAPARSDLFRVYGGTYDTRRFWLDDHELSSGSWLCDHSGVYLQSDWPQLSFGRDHQRNPAIQETQIFRTKEHIEAELYKYEDSFVLSESILDEWWHLLQEDVFTISRLHFGHFWGLNPFLGVPDWNSGLLVEISWQGTETWNSVGAWRNLGTPPDPSPQWINTVSWIKFSMLPTLQFAKAGIYLSDYSILSETNTCFAARLEEEFGDGPFTLSDADSATGENVLSEHIQRWEYQEWNERIDRVYQTTFTAAQNTANVGLVERTNAQFLFYEPATYGQFTLSDGVLSEEWHVLYQTAIHHEVGLSWGPPAQQETENWRGAQLSAPTHDWQGTETWESTGLVWRAFESTWESQLHWMPFASRLFLDQQWTGISWNDAQGYWTEEVLSYGHRNGFDWTYTGETVHERQHHRTLAGSYSLGTGYNWQSWQDVGLFTAPVYLTASTGDWIDESLESPWWIYDGSPETWETVVTWSSTEPWLDAVANTWQTATPGQWIVSDDTHQDRAAWFDTNTIWVQSSLSISTKHYSHN